MKLRILILISCVGLLAAGGVAGVTWAAVASSTAAASPTSAPSSCPKPASVLDPTSTYETPGPLTGFYVPAQPVEPGTPILTEEQILHPHGVSDSSEREPGTLRACQMSLADADELMPTGVKGIIIDQRPVWVVTDSHYPAASLPPRPGVDPATAPEFVALSSVTDAFTGFTIVGGFPVEALR